MQLFCSIHNQDSCTLEKVLRKKRKSLGPITSGDFDSLPLLPTAWKIPDSLRAAWFSFILKYQVEGFLKVVTSNNNDSIICIYWFFVAGKSTYHSCYLKVVSNLTWPWLVKLFVLNLISLAPFTENATTKLIIITYANDDNYFLLSIYLLSLSCKISGTILTVNIVMLCPGLRVI